MRDKVFREKQHGRMRLNYCRLHGLVRAVFRGKVGVALACAPVVCVSRFPSCRELWRRVAKLEDENAECQTDRAQTWLVAEKTQKNDDEAQAKPSAERELS
jgi:hypothetical protein